MEAALTVLEGATTLLHPLPPKGSLQGEQEENTLQLLISAAQGSTEQLPAPPVSKYHPVLSARVLSELLFALPK